MVIMALPVGAVAPSFTGERVAASATNAAVCLIRGAAGLLDFVRSPRLARGAARELGLEVAAAGEGLEAPRRMGRDERLRWAEPSYLPALHPARENG